jgi:hypothetical protein
MSGTCIRVGCILFSGRSVRKMKLYKQKTVKGYMITLRIGKNVQSSLWTSPQEKAINLEKEYLKGRYDLITTDISEKFRVDNERLQGIVTRRSTIQCEECGNCFDEQLRDCAYCPHCGEKFFYAEEATDYE